MWDSIDVCVCVSILTQQARRAKTLDELRRVQFPVDKLEFYLVDKRHPDDTNRGIYESHQRAMRQVLDRHPRADNILVLEDDVMFIKDQAVLRSVLRDLRSILSRRDCGVVRFGALPLTPYMFTSCYFARLGYGLCMHAYVVKRPFAERISVIPYTRWPIDVTINWWARFGLNGFVADPMIAYQHDGESDNVNCVGGSVLIPLRNKLSHRLCMQAMRHMCVWGHNPNVQAKLDKSLSSITDPVQRAAIQKLVQQMIEAKTAEPMDVDSEAEEEEDGAAEIDLALIGDSPEEEEDISDDGMELDEENMFDVDQYIDPKTNQLDADAAELAFTKWRIQKDEERHKGATIGPAVRRMIDNDDLLSYDRVTSEIDFGSKKREFDQTKLSKLLAEMAELTEIYQDASTSTRERNKTATMVARRCNEILNNSVATDKHRQTAQKWISALNGTKK